MPNQFMDDDRPYHARSGGYEASHIVIRGEGRLYRLSGFSAKTSAQFIQLHDASEVPADGTAPELVITVEASSEFAIDFGEGGRGFYDGIVVCNSSTGPTKTAGAADCWFDVVYEER
jgi:hypothetical protein